MKKLSLILFVIYTLASGAYAQQIKSNSIIATENLKEVLKSEVKSALEANGGLDQAALAQYFRTKFSERYYYDWQTFDDRFKQYNKLYNRQSGHQSRAADHMTKFADSTQWVLPFNYLNGLLVQLGNISQRVSRSLDIDASNGHIVNDADAQKLWSRSYEPGWEMKLPL